MWHKSLSSKSPSIQVLHQQIRGRGILVFADSADTGVGVQKYGKHADIILERSLRLTLGCVEVRLGLDNINVVMLFITNMDIEATQRFTFLVASFTHKPSSF